MDKQNVGNQENKQNLFVTKSIIFQSLSEKDKLKYKIFITTILKLARNSKRIKVEVPNIPNIELPHFTIVNKNDESETLTFLISENKWMIKSELMNFAIQFNPTAISGIITFLDDFELNEIEKGVEFFQDEMNELSLKYGIKY